MKLTLMIFVGLVVGVVALNFVGGMFIGEITTDIEIPEVGYDSSAESGKPAPYFNLSSLGEENISLSDLSGAPLVLTFWTTWNTLAADQVKILDDYLSRVGNNGPRVVIISSQEDKATVANFIKRGGYALDSLLDELGVVTERYSAHNQPVTYFIDATGIVQDVFVGVLSEKMFEEKLEQLIR